MKGKQKIYAVLWVDDYGSVPFSRKDIEWYHQNAGPISFAVEKDDRFPWGFDKTLNHDFSLDYVSHHYHSVRWKGSSLLKRIFDTLKLGWFAHHIIKFKLMRILLISSYRNPKIIQALELVASVVLLYFIYHISWQIFTVLIIPYIVLIGLISLWFYIHLPRNWEYPISNKEWNKRFLKRIKEELWEKGYEYPAVVRHGDNLPPDSTMEFYLSEMGVLADASANLNTLERYNRIGDREITWKIPHPYYASLHTDYNSPWNSMDEEDRGILELPVILGNAARLGFGENEKEMIQETPVNGLVSTYIHPDDNFSVIKQWVDYLKSNFDVKFITAEDYLRIFMAENPRPIIINQNLEVKWAFKQNGRLYPIRSVDKRIVSIEVLKQEEGFLEVVLEVNATGPIPEINILEETILQGVNPGRHRFKIAVKGSDKH